MYLMSRDFIGEITEYLSKDNNKILDKEHYTAL